MWSADWQICLWWRLEGGERQRKEENAVRGNYGEKETDVRVREENFGDLTINLEEQGIRKYRPGGGRANDYVSSFTASSHLGEWPLFKPLA